MLQEFPVVVLVFRFLDVFNGFVNFLIFLIFRFSSLLVYVLFYHL